MSGKDHLKIKRGLFRDPKHRQKMGEAIWYYGVIIDLVNWKTGTISSYRDEDIASMMSVPLSYVRRQRRRCEAEGYLKLCRMGPKGSVLEVDKWINPRELGAQKRTDNGALKQSPNGRQKQVLTPVTEQKRASNGEHESAQKHPLPIKGIDSGNQDSYVDPIIPGIRAASAEQNIFTAWAKAGGKSGPVITDHLIDLEATFGTEFAIKCIGIAGRAKKGDLTINYVWEICESRKKRDSEQVARNEPVRPRLKKITAADLPPLPSPEERAKAQAILQKGWRNVAASK